MRELLIQGLAQMGLSPDPEAVERLCRYAQLLLEQNKVMNLTTITQPEQVARLHFLDSAALLAWRGPQALAGKRLVDVGTGAGFPGVVLKILQPSLRLTLLDSLGKRIAWLEDVCKVLSLDGVQCIHGRAEELAHSPAYREQFDLAASRAVAAFPALCELCLPLVRPGGVFLAMKSVECGEELTAAGGALNRLEGRLLPLYDYPIPGTDVVHRLVPVEKQGTTPAALPRSWGRIKKSPL